jgi:hypothetical protein
LWRTAQGRFEAVFGAERAAELRSILSFLASEAFCDAYLRETNVAGRERSSSDS